MDAMIVVDMQTGLLTGPPKHDLQGVIRRINQLAAATRARSGKVVWIQHCGRPGDDFAPDRPGWAFVPEMDRKPADIVVQKTLNDPFAGTVLRATLDDIGTDTVVVAGWATDLCVDATVRSAVSSGYNVVAVADGHTLNDRPHLDARAVIAHHNWVWSELIVIANRSIRIATTAELLEDAARRR